MPNILMLDPGIQSSLKVSNDPWASIDKIYCISLDHRADRQKEAADQFARIGLGSRVEFIIGKKHATNAEHGNFIAQMKCLRAGVAAGARSICVFEDDIVFDRFTFSKLNQAVEFMKGNFEWNMLFLGCFVSSSKRTTNPSIIHVRFRSTTHAYVITREFAEKLLQIPWPGRCYDDLLCSMKDPGMFAVYPAFAFQSNSPTDNDKQIINDRFRRALGGMRLLQKWNEFSSLNFRWLVAVHAGIIVLMLSIAIIAHRLHR